MIIRIPEKDLKKKIKFFQKHKIPYRMVSTKGGSITIYAGRRGNWMNKESGFKPSELHFIKSVKDHIIKNNTFKGVRNNFKKAGSTKKIKYFYYNPKLVAGDFFENVREIDLKGAYWHQAYKLNLFDKVLYQKGLTVTKKSRLAAIGTLAKVKQIVEYNGKEEVNLPPERSKETEFLWNVISYRIGKIMARASKAAKNDFLFFWVDAIFIKEGPMADKVLKMFTDLGFQTTYWHCEWAKFDHNKITVKSIAKVEKNKFRL